MSTRRTIVVALVVGGFHFFLVMASIFLTGILFVGDVPSPTAKFLIHTSDVLLQPLKLVFRPDPEFPVSVALIAVGANSVLWGGVIAAGLGFVIRGKGKRAAF